MEALSAISTSACISSSLSPSFFPSLPPSSFFSLSLRVPFAHLDTESLTQTHTLTHTHTQSLRLSLTLLVSRTQSLSLSHTHTSARNLFFSFARSARLLHTQIKDTPHMDDTGARQEANFGPASTTAFFSCSRSRGNHGGLFVDPPVTYSFPSVEDPTLGTYSDRGHQGFLLSINIFHIIFKCRL